MTQVSTHCAIFHFSFKLNYLDTPPLDLSRSGPYFNRSEQATFVVDLTPSPTDAHARYSFPGSRQMSVDCSYEAPTILTPPKRQWHYRSTRDLAKKHIPFVSGDGPQRTPIRVKVNIFYEILTCKIISYIIGSCTF